MGSLLAVLLLLVLAPAAALAAGVGEQAVDRITVADVPDTGGEDCVDDPNAAPGVGLRQCPTTFDIGSVLPFVVGGGVVILVAIAGGWYLVMRRRVAQPFPADGTAAAAGAGSGGRAGASDDWWTCSTCGASNVVGSARCYKCGSWQR